MSSTLRRVVSLARAPLVVAALAWGCALDPAPEPAPVIDPSLPDVDGSWNPSPETPKEEAPGSSVADAGAGGASAGGDKDRGAVDGGESAPPRADAPRPSQGEILITEVMYDPSAAEPGGEWFEVHNTASGARALSGLAIVDGASRAHVIGGGVTVAPGAFVILARSRSAAASAKVPLVAVVYEYGAGVPDGSGVQLANGSSGAVFLRDGATIVAQADYGGWFSQAGGGSVQLRALSFAASAQSSSWCVSSKPWAAGADRGTPGAPSDCP